MHAQPANTVYVNSPSWIATSAWRHAHVVLPHTNWKFILCHMLSLRPLTSLAAAIHILISDQLADANNQSQTESKSNHNNTSSSSRDGDSIQICIVYLHFDPDSQKHAGPSQISQTSESGNNVNQTKTRSHTDNACTYSNCTPIANRNRHDCRQALAVLLQCHTSLRLCYATVNLVARKC